jgi:hypothetical protein
MRDAHTRNIAKCTAAKAEPLLQAVKFEVSFTPVKSHTPECAKIEQFAATLVPLKAYQFCGQDFKTRDYTLELDGKSVTITQKQFDGGMWQEIVRRALQ